MNKKLGKKMISEMNEEDKAYYRNPEIRKYYYERFDDDEIERRKWWLWHGLTGMIHLELMHDELWAIVFVPDEGFLHLKNRSGLKAMEAEGQKYHISICFKSDIDREWKNRALNTLHRLYDSPSHHQFVIKGFSSGLTAIIDPADTIYEHIKELHMYGSYHYKEIHMSL